MKVESIESPYCYALRLRAETEEESFFLQEVLRRQGGNMGYEGEAKVGRPNVFTIQWSKQMDLSPANPER